MTYTTKYLNAKSDDPSYIFVTLVGYKNKKKLESKNFFKAMPMVFKQNSSNKR